jgi:hypothetical protein
MILSCLAVVALAAVALTQTALADSVKAQTFQLDGNIAQDATSPVTYDWANFFDSSGAKSPILPDASRPGYTASSFVRDFKTKANGAFDTSDASTYTIGSKDTLDVNGWSCTPANNVTDKGDIMNAYAVAYTAPGPAGHKFMFFAMERNANAGDANVAFWFLQGGASCPAAGGSFTGSHHNGDLLIVSAFTNGGSVSTIDAYEWQNGALNTTPVAHGQDCRTGTVTGDPTCATANTGTLSNIPWLTENKADGVGHTLQSGEFFEGGIDLSAPSVNLANNCFNTFIPDTRSSQSLTATLYDFAIGQLGECKSTTSTTPVDATDTSQPPASSIPLDPNDAKVTVKDHTTVGVTGISSFNAANSNNLSWHICGPSAATSTQLCDGTAGNVGVAVGSQAITAPGQYDSPTVTLTEAGRYCFRADFAGDSVVGVPPSSDSSAGECFTISPAQPSLTTAASTGPVDFGQPINDSVTLSGTAHEPGTGGPTGSDGSINPTALGGDATGNIVVKAYGPDSCTTVAFTSSAIGASGDGTYGGAGSAFEFTPTAPGQYVFVASYAGDPPNTLGIAASACSAAPPAEKVTVRQIPTGIKTKQSWYPQDTATISATIGNLAAGGSVEFDLYDNATCSGTAKYTETDSVAGGNPTATVTTNNTTFAITSAFDDPAASTAGPYSWKVVYTPATADTAHLGTQSSCNAENHSITYTNDPGPNTG